MLDHFLAEDAAHAGGFTKLLKSTIALAVFAVTFAIAMCRRPSDAFAVQALQQMPRDKVEELRSGAPRQARSWLMVVAALAVYQVGRQVYLSYVTPESWSGRALNLVMFVLFMLLPPLVSLLLLLKPREASDQRLTFCSNLMLASAALVAVWAVMYFISGAGPWLGGVWYLFLAVPSFLCSYSISQIRSLRRYDEAAKTHA